MAMIPTASTRMPIRFRLSLLTLAGAAAGVLFAPFVLAAEGRGMDANTFLIFGAGSGLVCLVSAFIGLRCADSAGLPMPLLRAWERGEETAARDWVIIIFAALASGAAGGAFAVYVTAHAGLPHNPGPLWMRLATTPFGAIIPETIIHLGLMSVLVRLLKSTTFGVLVSALVFVALFHAPSQREAPIVLALIVSTNLVLGLITGILYARVGFEAALLGHGVAHAIALGFN